MKIGIFTDSHINSISDSNDFKMLEIAFENFSKSNVDAVICLGDLIDECPNIESAKNCLNQIKLLINKYNFLFFLAPGNHDCIQLGKKEFYDILGVTSAPYSYVIDGKKIIFLDANYSNDNKRFDEIDFDWQDTNIPDWQIEFLCKELDEFDGECIIAVHECLDPEFEINKPYNLNYNIKQSKKIRKIFDDSGKVKLVLCGHYHFENENIVNGISYKTFAGLCENNCKNRFVILEI